jgi:filamentous hemagglutinin family protein
MLDPKIFPSQLVGSLLLSCCVISPAAAQISSDGNLSTSVTTPDNRHFTINNGNRAGNNLFHSFQEFSVPTNGSAFFNNAADVQNIFSRVTGGNISNIDGLLRANGGANLFLLNPAGIVFGPNARLDIGGSFFGTTAESVVFQDGSVFSATEPNAPPLLTIDVPVGLQMGSNPGKIAIQGSGHNITAANPVFSPYGRSPSNSELKVQSGNTIALIGGDITLEGGVLMAESGRIDLTAIGNNQAEPPIVNLSNTSSGWSVNSVELGQLGDISLSRESLVDASGTGSIQLQGRNISLSDGSLALIQNTTSAAAGDITIRAAEVLQLDGMSANGEVRSGLENQTLATGNAGGIQVVASDVIINNGAAIFARTFRSGTVGDIVVNASGKIQATGFSLLKPTSSANSIIGSLAFGTGNSGNIEVSATELTLLDAGNITTTTFGQGNAGSLTVDVVNSIELSGFNPFTRSVAVLLSGSFGAGNAGNSRIQAGQIRLSNSGRISSGGFATGNAGNVIVNASEFIEISGETSVITSSVNILPKVTRAIFRLPDVPSGDAGSVTLNTPVLRLQDKGAVSVRNEGVGNAGSLQINAHRIELNRQGAISASTNSGEGGNITLTLRDVLIARNNSSIDTTSNGIGNGGNITIASPIIIGLENSDIIANAVRGNGGRINITTQGIFGLENRPQRTDESDITASSQFGISGTVAINNPDVDPGGSLTQLPEDVTDPSQQIATGCSALQESQFVVTGRGGLPPNPTERLNSTRTWSDVRDLSAFRSSETVAADRADAGTDENSPRLRTVVAEPEPVNPPAIVEATGWMVNEAGNVELVAVVPNGGAPTNAMNCAGAASH